MKNIKSIFLSLLFLFVITGCNSEEFENYSVFDINSHIREEIVFQSTPNERPVYRIPSLCITNNHTLLVVCENRQIIDDKDEIDILLARRVDNEAIWEKQVLFEMGDGKGRTMNPIFLVDRQSGRIYVFASHFRDNTKFGYEHDTSECDVVYKYSDDDGLTWSEEISLKKYWDITKYTGISSSASNGITLADGTFLIPMIVTKDKKFYSSLLIKEIGKEWRFSSLTPNEWDNECTVYLDKHNNIVLDCRTLDSVRNKYVYDIKNDMFTQIESDRIDSNLPVKAEISRCIWKDKTFYLMSYPYTKTGTRENMSLFGSKDGINWFFLFQFEQGYNGMGYSNLASYQNKTVIVYESYGTLIKLMDISLIMDNIVGLIYK